MKTKEEHIAAILNIIHEKKVMRFAHLPAYYPLSRSQLYNLGLDKVDDIKEAIEQNRMKAKNIMLNKWIASDNATLQIAAFRLMADDEERRALNQQYLDMTSNGQTLPSIEIVGMEGGRRIARSEAEIEE